ncbi:hypothetical protein DS2_12709 [Catenovulum agarivorans DS-2]|uniref:Lon N-terminal domain-containing protein n=1 Tax=Catenovulum agarivorans DS-2 TaxID=1328313 RepID=W7QBN1_9ALTE|nr:LON peptidase substrate-binding domain-containing protein [Catenovulum agarivorans]EWH09396.1 hypothetical protein DS2_12709 [Catenovulum agarivorans DS-2]
MQLGVFPLPLVLFPKGITQLKIFEPRYVRLVKQAASGQGFVLSTYLPDAGFSTSSIGAWVDIIDFEKTADGLLIIDIYARELVEISNVKVESDGLRVADVTPVKHWPDAIPCANARRLSAALKEIHSSMPEYAKMYPQPEFDNPSWVCARFIELLPLPVEKKLEFLSPSSYNECIEFLATIISGENKSDPIIEHSRRYS